MMWIKNKWEGIPKKYLTIVAASLMMVQVLLGLIFASIFYYQSQLTSWIIVVSIALSYMLFALSVFARKKMALRIFKAIAGLMILFVFVFLNPFLWPDYTAIIKALMIILSILWFSWWAYVFHVTEKIEDVASQAIK